MNPSTPIQAGTPLAILLVEDNPGDVRLIQEMLRGLPNPGSNLVHRGRLSEAQRYLLMERPDVILLDLGLPDAYGLEAMGALRRLAVGTPVVVLTSLDDERLAHRSLEQGAQDYLVKGRFDAEMLHRSMRYAMDRQRREADLRASEARTRKLVEACLIGLALADVDGHILEANQAFLDLLGLTQEEVGVGKVVWDSLVAETDQDRHTVALGEVQSGYGHPPWEVEFQKHDGSSVPVLLGAARLGGPVFGVVVYAMDTSERRAHLEQLQREARQDALTGLMNRRAFLEVLEPAMAASQRYGHPLCLALCDLDHFKQINDRHSHGAGDEVLRAFGEILDQEIRGDDVAARLGGDEFCILFAHTPSALASKSLERVRAAFARRTFTGPHGEPFSCTVTLGLVDLPVGIKAAEGLCQLADEALYRAKRTGGNRIEVA